MIKSTPSTLEMRRLYNVCVASKATIVAQKHQLKVEKALDTLLGTNGKVAC